MNKKDVYNLIVSGSKEFGNLKREGVFRRVFPQIYNDFLNTQFIPEIKNKTFRVKLWHFLTNTNYIPTCKKCGNPVKFNNSGYFGYCVYCSTKCCNSDFDFLEKKKQTYLNHYGCENPMQSVEVKNKLKQTCIKKYGEDNYSKTKECKDKVRNSFINHYGVSNYSQTNEWQEKVKQTNNDRYGCDFYMQTNEYKERVRETNLEKYGTEYTFQSDDIKKKFKMYVLKDMEKIIIHKLMNI